MWFKRQQTPKADPQALVQRWQRLAPRFFAVTFSLARAQEGRNASAAAAVFNASRSSLIFPPSAMSMPA